MGNCLIDTGSSVLVERGRFVIRVAETEAEIAAAQHLRYRIFHREQGRRLAGCDTVRELDCDEFDAQFTHLLVLDRESDRVVGTYRMQSGATARRHCGFYSAGEYEIAGLEAVADRTWELGRSCVAPEYRSGAVISLLWAGIVEMRRRNPFRYLIGCASLERTAPELGWALYEHLRRQPGVIRLQGRARPGYRLPEPEPVGKTAWLLNEPALQRELPPLMKGYLRLGAEVIGEPVWDRKFGSVDFLMGFDFDAIAARYARHFDV